MMNGVYAGPVTEGNTDVTVCIPPSALMLCECGDFACIHGRGERIGPNSVGHEDHDAAGAPSRGKSRGKVNCSDATKDSCEGWEAGYRKPAAEAAKAPAPRKSKPTRRIDDSIRDQYEAYTTEDEKLLQAMPHPDDFTRSDTWRVLRIMGEFIEGFDKLANVGKAVTVFGSARTASGRSAVCRGGGSRQAARRSGVRDDHRARVRELWKRRTRARSLPADAALAATSSCRSSRERIRTSIRS